MTEEAKSTVVIPSIYTSDSKHPEKVNAKLLSFEASYKKISADSETN
jgi:hypothetical protein